jgi:hypothetical protein
LTSIRDCECRESMKGGGGVGMGVGWGWGWGGGAREWSFIPAVPSRNQGVCAVHKHNVSDLKGPE